MTRRFFLKVLSLLGLSWLFPEASLAGSPEQAIGKNLEALTEAIMPGAGAMGIPHKVMNFFAKIPEGKELFVPGMNAVEKYSLDTHKKSFHLLGESEKAGVLGWMDGLNEERPEKRYFNKLRKVVLAHYYTSPETWKHLKYAGPPQPHGFMDYHQKPGRENEREL